MDKNGRNLIAAFGLTACLWAGSSLCAGGNVEVQHEAGSARQHDIAELWGDLHLSTDASAYDSMLPFLARTVAPENPTWGPTHPRWASVVALINREFHEDIDVAAARAQQALGEIWKHSLDQVLTAPELSQLLEFYHSGAGRRYMSYQERLRVIETNGAALLLRRFSTSGSADAFSHAAASAEVLARRERIENVSFQMLLASACGQTIAAQTQMKNAILATQGRALDALGREFQGDLGEFEAFNREPVIDKLKSACGIATTAWASDSAKRELDALLAAEPQKRAAEWNAAYVAP